MSETKIFPYDENNNFFINKIENRNFKQKKPLEDIVISQNKLQMLSYELKIGHFFFGVEFPNKKIPELIIDFISYIGEIFNQVILTN